MIRAVEEREKAFDSEIKRMEKASTAMQVLAKQLDGLPNKMTEVLRNDRRESSAQMARLERLMDEKWSALAEKCATQLGKELRAEVDPKWREISEFMQETLGVDEGNRMEINHVDHEVKNWMDEARPTLQAFLEHMQRWNTSLGQDRVGFNSVRDSVANANLSDSSVASHRSVSAPPHPIGEDNHA